MTFDDARLRKRVAWLNNAGGFENTIIYSQVAAAAEGLSDSKIMEILKYLEDKYDKVWDPMRWILSSLEKARQASEGLDAEFDQQLRRRVRWLNNEGGFENKIVYSKIAEAAVGLESGQVMDVFKYLEERWEFVDDPTAWVCSALRKMPSGGGMTGGSRGGYGAAYAPGAGGSWASAGLGHAGPGGGGGGKGASSSWSRGEGKGDSYDDFDSKLWRRIVWLNSSGGFQNSIQYPQVAEAAEGVDNAKVFDLLNHLEANWQKVGDPTRWVCSSLQKARGGGAGSGGGYWNENKDREIRRRVRALNNEGGFENTIVYDKIAEAAQGVDLHKVLELLQRLEENWENVGDPNAWVCTGLRNIGGGAGYSGSGGSSGYGGYGGGGAQSQRDDAEFDRKLRTRVRWLNNEGGFENNINYSKISQAANGVSSEKVLSALKYLEDKGPASVDDPTAWVCAGLSKVRRGGGGQQERQQERRPPPMRHQRRKEEPQPENGEGGEEEPNKDGIQENGKASL